MNRADGWAWLGVVFGVAGLASVSGCRIDAPAEVQVAPAVDPIGASSPVEPARSGEPIDASRPPAEPPAPPEPALGVVDRGIFNDLDPRVQVELPPAPARLSAVVDAGRSLLLVYAAGRPVKAYPILAGEVEPARTLALAGLALRLRPGDHTELASRLDPNAWSMLPPGTSAPPGDLDADGLPDPLDLDLGAIKTTLNGARYNQDYFVLDYPGGDVDRELGACTDVIVRALRNAGLDLQREVHEDIARAPRRYPMVKRANDDIDHRRVKTLLPWFRAHWLELPDDAALAPGDVVFMDTIAARSGPDHIGIVGDRVGGGGRLLVANNWTDGYTTAFMDLLEFVEVTHRFRLPPAPEHAGPIPALARQLVVVRGRGWDDFHAELHRFERSEVGGAWTEVGSAIPVVLGHAGLAWGRGLHGDEAPQAAGREGGRKREGDGRSPAGVFALGDAWGREPDGATGLDYAVEGAGLRCVDDPGSAHYGRIVDGDEVTPDWASAEAMARLYALAIVIEHNPEHAAGGGSCIFLHAWDGPDEPVTGCTAMASEALDLLAAWLRPEAVLVSLPGSSYARLRGAWALPELPEPATRTGSDGGG